MRGFGFWWRAAGERRSYDVRRFEPDLRIGEFKREYSGRSIGRVLFWSRLGLPERDDGRWDGIWRSDCDAGWAFGGAVWRHQRQYVRRDTAVRAASDGQGVGRSQRFLSASGRMRTIRGESRQPGVSEAGVASDAV